MRTLAPRFRLLLLIVAICSGLFIYLVSIDLPFFRSKGDSFVRRLQPISAVPIGLDEQSIELKLSSLPAPRSFRQYGVVNCFTGTGRLAGAMQLRPYPRSKDRWLVATFTGKLLDIQRIENRLLIRTVLDISSRDHGWLYSFALHPRFAAESLPQNSVYVFYRDAEQCVPMHYRVSAFELHPKRAAGLGDEKILIEQEIAHLDHLGGALEFDNDGYLLIALGDNGRSHDDSQNSQKIDKSLFSGVLRIDVDRRGGDHSQPPSRAPKAARTGGYYIPLDNPFNEIPNANQEFWALGLRSPYRMSVDRQTGQVWVGEVGQDDVEQLEIVKSGSNHMWSYREGTKAYNKSYLQGTPPKTLHGQPAEPYYQYLHKDQDYCVVGGFVYRGKRFPELNGRYLFGDNQSSRLWSISIEDPSDLQLLMQLPTGKKNSSLTSIAADEDGRIFLTHFAAGATGVSVHELVYAEPPAFPEKLSDLNVFADLSKQQIHADIVPYQVNSPLWSDGMEKHRYFKLPPGKQIGNPAGKDRPWKFPDGTLFIKHFTNPAAANRPIETRVLMLIDGQQLCGATYQWNDDATDATLLLSRESLQQPIPSGAITDGSLMAYNLPAPDDCLVCHNRDNPILGLNLAQLNCLDPVEATQNQLVSLSGRQIFENAYDVETLSSLPKLSGIDRHDSDLETKARSYLHSNCSYCHYPEGTQRTEFDARIQTPLSEAKMIGIKANTGYLRIDGQKSSLVIDPGNPDNSVLYHRLTTRTSEHSMPYLGRCTTDKQGTVVLREWILSLKN